MKKAAISIALAPAMLILVLAPGWADASSTSGQRQLPGSWQFTIDTGVPDAPLARGFILFDSRNSLTTTTTITHSNSESFDVFCACNASDGFGAWERTGRRNYAFSFKAYLFASDDTSAFALDLTEPLVTSGQHIGFVNVHGEVRLVGRDSIVGTTSAEVVNLDGTQLNPDVPPMTGQAVTGSRLKVTE